MLELRGVTKRYGDRVAVDDLSLTVSPGKMVGFVGTNGAGKTTTMRIIMGVLQQDVGQVLWRGAPADADARRTFGYMPEERGLYPKMRIRDQLIYLAKLRGTDPARATKAADQLLAEFGLAERAGDRVEQLSLGNQQRVQLAAALVHDPEFLILDEPFSGLDPVGVDALADSLHTRVSKGVGVLFSSHQLELVERLCDEVVIIQAGKIVAAGPVAELREKHQKRQFRLVVGAPAGWSAAVTAGRTIFEASAGDGLTETLVELADGADSQVLLDAARARGPVLEFRRLTPTLAELFREAVTDTDDTPSSPTRTSTSWADFSRNAAQTPEVSA
ncbi:MAG TPA: ATP-binding cassette domain-containing protein [Actinopolymorphaceae bacterium]